MNCFEHIKRNINFNRNVFYIPLRDIARQIISSYVYSINKRVAVCNQSPLILWSIKEVSIYTHITLIEDTKIVIEVNQGLNDRRHTNA